MVEVRYWKLSGERMNKVALPSFGSAASFSSSVVVLHIRITAVEKLH